MPIAPVLVMLLSVAIALGGAELVARLGRRAGRTKRTDS
jgi:hypothetical protein